MPVSQPRAATSLFSRYAAQPPYYDEVLDERGRVRPHWDRFDDATQSLGPQEFARRWAQTQRLLERNRLSSPDSHDASHARSPWDLDPVPLVLSSEEWRGVSQALAQRARLLDLTLSDLFGAQQLLTQGVLPPELMFHHPGYQLPLADQSPAGGRFVHFYAADLARAPDGRWWVLADRTEAPSGLGYALENRITISRMLSDVLKQCEIERLAPFFVKLREHLAGLDPQRRANPRVMLLSQQAGGHNYFEDAFLCRYLGYTLAESNDLAVRKNHVFMKTLAGLTPVDVLVRRPNSEECDPLELAGSAVQGVAGLLNASRTRSVAVANALGSGLVESPAFLAFLPRLCQAMLGERLAMPGVATWWCGQEDALSHVLENLDSLVVKPAYRRRGHETSAAREFAELPRDQLTARIQAAPHRFVAQERVARSTAPLWGEQGVTGAYIVLRAFAVASGDGYAVMPGGLARVSRSLDPLEVSLTQGERSKDTWVLADGPVEQVSLLQSTDETVPLRRGGAEMPSRVAENLFWLGRHTERADALARLLRTVIVRLASDEDAARIAELPNLIRALAEYGQIEPGYALPEMHGQLPPLEQALPAAVFDNAQPGALRAIVTQLARSAATVRDRMSLDSWRVIHQMDEEFWPSAGPPDVTTLLERLDALRVNLSAFAGLAMESMTRTQAWRFLELGRRIERALKTAELISAVLQGDEADEHGPLEAMLETADSLMTYRSRYLAQLRLGPALDLLITDETNPRSVAYQLVECQKHVDQLPRDAAQPGYTDDQWLAMELLHTVRMADSQALAKAFHAGDREPLGWLLAETRAMLPKLANAISHRYLLHAGPAHRLAGIDPLSE